MNKHTPEPWGKGEYHLAVNAGQKHIAMISHYMRGNPDVDVSLKEAYANRDLIIVAPDLLAACEAAVRYDKAICACANDPDRMSSYCSAQGEDLDALYLDWITKARAAIAKIKGNQ